MSEFTAATQAPAPALDLMDDIPVAYRPDEIAREATRYLVFLGDVQAPREKRERANPLGGEHYGQQYQCLVRSKGQLRRAQITPLEIGYDFINDELIGDNPNKLLVSSILVNEGKAVVNLGGKLNAVPIYPGDQIRGILVGDRNQDQAKGVVEVKAIAGMDYPEFKASGIQEFIFEDWAQIIAGFKPLPNKLSETMALLGSRKNATSDETIRNVIDAYLLSGEQFREWGIRYLKVSTMLVRQPAHQGFVHTYSDVAEMLFDQLEIKREDLLRSDAGSDGVAEAISKLNNGGIGTSEITQLLTLLTKNQEVIQDLLTGKIPVGDKAPVETIPVVEEKITSVVGAAPQPVHPDRQQEGLDPRLCQTLTLKGTQCQRLAKENGHCDLPAHQPGA